MLGANPVAQFQVMMIARTAAVRVVRAGREESAKDAMLHVEHRNVLVNSDLEPFRGRGLHERFELSEVQVIGGGEALQAELVLEVIGTEAIRDIEREIADAPVVCKKPQMIVVANQVTVGLAGTDLFERLFLAHLENPWRSHEDCQFPIADLNS